MTAGDRRSMQLVIFTDLDGTFLERRTYRYAESLPALQSIKERGVPLVFCSSKTRAEQEALRARFGIRDPFVVEDGGAVYIEKGYFPFSYTHQRTAGSYHVIEFGKPYADVRRGIAAAAAETELSLRGYGDMDAAEVAEVTGLDPESALRAKEREYEETLVGGRTSEEDERLARALSRHGLVLTRGVRFYQVRGVHDKGIGARLLTELYGKRYDGIVTAAVGDAGNDLPLLSVVDRPYLVEKDGGGWIETSIPGLRRVRGIGPAGWGNAVEELLG